MKSLAEIKAIVRAHEVRPVGDFMRFSVLLPLVTTSDGICLLFETRSDQVSQPGESSFPGGRIEPGETAEQAALRETVEELGIPEKSIELFGKWNPLITYHNMLIEPYVGQLIDYDPGTFVPNDEVAETFLVPLSYFVTQNPSTYTTKLYVEPPKNFPYQLLPNKESYTFRTGESTTLFWVWKERVIWGLTARITQDFIEHIRRNYDAP